MMRTIDEHLESALDEYNKKIAVLEINGSREELLEALVNRSTILLMMEYFTSSMSDIEDALEIAQEMKDLGERVDVGSLVKLYENRGQMAFGDDDERMIEDYSKITSYLDDIRAGIRHYDHRGLVSMCIGCAEDLVDEGYNENSMPFIDKGLELLSDGFDAWTSNRRVELLNLKAQASNGMGLTDDAYAAYTDAINIAVQLYKQFKLDDELQLVLAFVDRGDISDLRKDQDRMLSDHESAIDILEQLNDEGKLDDLELLVNLHQNVSQYLLSKNMTKEAEAHLLRAVKLGMPEINTAINDLGLNDGDDDD